MTMTGLPATCYQRAFGRLGSLSCRAVPAVVLALWPVAAASAAGSCDAYGPPANRVELAFQPHPVRDALVIRVQVDGRERTFFVDTGAAHTVVDTRAAGLAATFTLQRARFSERRPGLAGSGVVAHVDLTIGGRTWPGRRVVVMDLSELDRVFDGRVEGIVGMDLLREFGQVVISFAGRRLCLGD
jgi:hypothetical protein